MNFRKTDPKSLTVKFLSTTFFFVRFCEGKKSTQQKRRIRLTELPIANESMPKKISAQRNDQVNRFFLSRTILFSFLLLVFSFLVLFFFSLFLSISFVVSFLLQQKCLFSLPHIESVHSSNGALQYENPIGGNEVL